MKYDASVRSSEKGRPILVDSDPGADRKARGERVQRSFRRSIRHAPLFESPFERRRLRLVKAIFVALERCGMRCTLRGKDPKDFDVRVGNEHITFRLNHPGQERDGYRPASEANRPISDKLQLRISPNRTLQDARVLWEDKAGDTIETHVSEIVASIVVAGEVQYRQSEIGYHRWLIERKAQLIEEARKHKEEAERRERERRRKAEQARVDRLLGEAGAFRQANDIRAYVD